MKFNLKNDNYSDFGIYKKNVLFPRSYFISFSTPEEMAKTDIRTQRYNSSVVDVLSGEWDFVYYEKESLLPLEFDTDSVKFDKVNVPSVWQHTGYEKPYYVNSRYQFNPNPPEIPVDCPVGVYHRTFVRDENYSNFVLSFLGVAGGLDVFINGKFVGYSEGSHNTAEFEVDEFLTEGENHLVVVNHKFTNGTYLECQDMFRDNGIFRDVLLHKYTKNSIYDFEAKTDFNSDFTYNLLINPSLKLVDECEFNAALFGDDGIIASKSVNVNSEEISSICFENLKVDEWSAENPKLYTLVLSLSLEGKVIQLIRHNVGFKHIRITGNVFTFNNKNIKLLGVNHHDTNPKTGYAMTVEDMEKDVSIFKQYNVNCVRTSHYPPDPTFLDLCDEYGVYVIDEADIETHGCEVEMHRPGACSHNELWQPRYWDRVLRMFERDKNHPSITMWSLGNEAHGYLNQDFCYNELKRRSDIPIHYEGVCRTKRWAYDVVSQMYPWHSLVRKVAKGSGLTKKFYTKPYFMCEYAHAMGLGAGELEEYVKYILEADNILGGCIWEFADHAAYHENGAYKYTYGGDHGEAKHDGNFCVDGLFFPDRTPHSGALQMKNCYRPVRAKALGDDTYEFYNYNCFTNARFKVEWLYLVDGVCDQCGEFELDIEPHFRQCVNLSFQHKSGDQALTFTYFKDGEEIASEQFVDFCDEHNISADAPDEPCRVTTSQDKVIVHFDDGEFVFDTKSGRAVSYIKNGKQYINTAPFGDGIGFGLSVYRAPIDNDMNIKRMHSRLALDTETLYPIKTIRADKAYKIIDNRVVISYSYRLNTAKAKNVIKADITYSVYKNGSLEIEAECTHSKNFIFAPRFGLTLEMPKAFDEVEYYGLGDKPNLSDYKEHALLGIYKSKVADMHEAYIKPQESSMRSDTLWASVTNAEGEELRFTCLNGRMVFSADHYSSRQCAKARHNEELQECNTTYLHFDSYMLGAGSNACGPVPSKSNKRSTLKGEHIRLLVEFV